MALFTQSIKNLGFTSYEEIKNYFSTPPENLCFREEEDLYMVSFTDSSDLKNPLVRECNGTILDKKTNQVLYVGFDKCYDGIDKDGDSYKDPIDCESSNWCLEPMIEGSIVKLFYFQGNWRWSTSRHTDARKNKWSSNKSYQELIEECIFPSFYDDLNPKECYTYILQHPENYTVYPNEEMKLTLLSTVDLTNFKLKDTYSDTIIIKSLEDLQLFRSRYDPQNMMLYCRESCIRIKLITEEYKKMASLRGNYPDIRTAYLRSNPYERKDMYKYFPLLIPTFKELEERIKWFSSNIHWLYFHNYVKKERHVVPPLWRKTLYLLHGHYLKTLVPITRSTVDWYITHYIDPKTLQKIIELPSI